METRSTSIFYLLKPHMSKSKTCSKTIGKNGTNAIKIERKKIQKPWKAELEQFWYFFLLILGQCDNEC